MTKSFLIACLKMHTKSEKKLTFDFTRIGNQIVVQHIYKGITIDTVDFRIADEVYLDIEKVMTNEMKTDYTFTMFNSKYVSILQELRAEEPEYFRLSPKGYDKGMYFESKSYYGILMPFIFDTFESETEEDIKNEAST